MNVNDDALFLFFVFGNFAAAAAVVAVDIAPVVYARKTVNVLVLLSFWSYPYGERRGYHVHQGEATSTIPRVHA